MNESTMASYMESAPKEWDDDYRRLWAKYHVAQDKIRTQRENIERLVKVVERLADENEYFDAYGLTEELQARIQYARDSLPPKPSTTGGE